MKNKSSLLPRDLIRAWAGILVGRMPLLSIEITRECPLTCPGCYAYGDTHLGGEKNLRDLSDFKGDDLVNGVIGLVKRHRPLHVSLVGGEPLMRHRELDQILPALSAMNVFTMVVTSAVIPIPQHWMKIPRTRVAISVDGLPEHHDVRRKPATYERILRNIEGREVNVHWTITRPMMERSGYLEEYVAFWATRPEVNFVWVSVYSPQMGESSDEMLTPADREELVRQLPELRRRYPKFLINEGIARTFTAPPANPDECIFSKMSVNYTADLNTRVEPCIFGGTPDCSQCGCAITSALHWLGDRNVAGPLKIRHLVRSSVAVGSVIGRLNPERLSGARWNGRQDSPQPAPPLVQIGTQ
jgi:MoaA/NifB/PqqE/SkfB family radical SAM enzyme